MKFVPELAEISFVKNSETSRSVKQDFRKLETFALHFDGECLHIEMQRTHGDISIAFA